jgi:hypothetical protein
VDSSASHLPVHLGLGGESCACQTILQYIDMFYGRESSLP